MAGVSSETLNVSRSVALDTSLTFEAVLRLLTNATYLHGTFLVPHSQHMDGHKLGGLDTTHPFELYKMKLDLCSPISLHCPPETWPVTTPSVRFTNIHWPVSGDQRDERG